MSDKFLPLRKSALLSERAHGIPRLQLDELLLENFFEFLGKIFLVDGDFVGVFAEPFVSHGQEALAFVLVAPAVFDEPADGFALAVDIDGRQDHGVVHAALIIVEALGLVEFAAGAAEEILVVHVEVEDAQVAVELFAYVAAEPDDFAALDGLDGGLLHDVHFNVEVADGMAAHHVAEELHGVHLLVGFVLGRGVDQTDVVVKVDAHEFLVELLRGHDTFAVEFAFLIAPLPHEFRGRSAHVDGKDVVELLDHFAFLGSQGGDLFAFLVGFPQSAGEFFQLAGEDAVHGAGGAAAVALGIDRLGNETVLLDQIDHHVPLAAVAQRIAEKVLDKTAVGLLFHRLKDGFEEVVGLFQFVPEHRVSLGELELVDVHLLDGFHPESVQSGEKPAAAAALLVSDSRSLDVIGEDAVRGLDDVPVGGGGSRAALHHGVHRQFVLRTFGKILGKLAKIFFGEVFVHNSP